MIVFMIGRTNQTIFFRLCFIMKDCSNEQGDKFTITDNPEFSIIISNNEIENIIIDENKMMVEL